MPRLKKGCLEDAMTKLSNLIVMHQKDEGMSDESMAHLIRPGTKTSKGMHERTFHDKAKDPERFTVLELAVMMRRLHFTEEDVLRWVRPLLMEDKT